MTDDGLRDKLARQGEETLGKLAQDLLENPLVSGALTRAFEARERAVQAQEVAMGALNLPSAADVERLTRRIRSVAQRLEGIEDSLDRLDRRLEGLGDGGSGTAGDVAARLAELTEEVRGLGAKLEAGEKVQKASTAGKAKSGASKPAAKSRASKSGGSKPAAKSGAPAPAAKTA